ncbi:glutathione S-transferase zeta class-like protein [Tanacetum coccineum]
MEQESETMMKLFSHPISSCSRRVRLALHLKGLKYECIIINPVGNPELLKVNPMGYIPALVDGTTVVSDSYAILLYLEEKYPQHALLPQDLIRKTINYQNYIGELVSPDEKLPWAQYHIRKGFVGKDLQKLVTNMKRNRVKRFLFGTNIRDRSQLTMIADIIMYLKLVGSDIPQSYIRENDQSLYCVITSAALEKLLANHAGKYATGDEIFLADLYLAPQIDNALNRYNVDMTEFPLLLKLNKAYREVPSFQQILAEQPQEPSAKAITFYEINKAPEENKREITIAMVTERGKQVLHSAQIEGAHWNLRNIVKRSELNNRPTTEKAAIKGQKASVITDYIVEATLPPSFALEVFVHCDGETRFRRLCEPFLYSPSSYNVLEVEAIVTNHLVVRGSYAHLDDFDNNDGGGDQ